MTLVLHTNLASIQSQTALKGNQRGTDAAMARLSTGVRVNTAKDDAAGAAIGQRMTTQVRGLDQAFRNINDGVSLLQTADGGLSTAADLLQRMRELAVQSLNDTLSSEQRGYLQQEFSQLQKEIVNITDSTTWNGKKLLDGSFIDQKLQVGANEADILTLSIPGLDMITTDWDDPAWTRMTASTGSAYIDAMTMGPDGYLYTAGPMNGSIDGQQATQEDFLVSKYDTDGQRIWSKLLGAGIGVEVAHAITVGSDGSIYVAGSTNGSLTDPTVNNFAVADILVAKFSPDGTLQWAQQLGTVNDDRAFSLTTDDQGAVYLTGATTGNLDGSSTATGGVFALNPAADSFITKMDADGTLRWTRQLEGTRVGNGIAAGADGSLYVVGEMNGPFNGMTPSGPMDGYLMKIDGDGAIAWSQKISTGTVDDAIGVTVAANGDVYITGTTYGELEGSNLLGLRESYIARYGDDGSQVWMRQLNLGSYNAPTSITVDSEGTVTIGGWWPDDGTEQGGSAFIAQYSSDGQAIETQRIAGRYSRAMGVANDPLGGVYIGGTSTYGVNGQPFSGPVDSFLMKYPERMDVSIPDKAADTLSRLDQAIDAISRLRADLGAYMNRLTYAGDNASNMSVNLGASRSGIIDADYARETVALAKGQIIQQATTAVLAQANQRPQDVLKLLTQN